VLLTASQVLPASREGAEGAATVRHAAGDLLAYKRLGLRVLLRRAACAAALLAIDTGCIFAVT
jgi:hypothetical protein